MIRGVCVILEIGISLLTVSADLLSLFWFGLVCFPVHNLNYRHFL